MPDLLRNEVADGVALVTLHRPEARNALNTELLAALPAAMAALDADPGVDVIVLTGADPAFCAGLDLKELGSTGGNLRGAGLGGSAPAAGRPWAETAVPVIGAVNGPAVTGGLEVALHCDLLVASERARFADTHARVGVLPGWGLTYLLPRAVGWRRAVEMSLTGNFVDADEALRLGLVSHVVPHADLLPLALGLAADVRTVDPDAARTLLATYRRGAALADADAARLELEVSRDWASRRFDPAEVERRRSAIVERGRSQQGRLGGR